MSAPVRIALSLEIVEMKLKVVWVIEYVAKFRWQLYQFGFTDADTKHLRARVQHVAFNLEQGIIISTVPLNLKFQIFHQQQQTSSEQTS